MGVATLCSDAGKVTQELKLGVSGSTFLEDVGLRWFPSSLYDAGFAEPLDSSSPKSKYFGIAVRSNLSFDDTLVGLSWNCRLVRR